MTTTSAAPPHRHAAACGALDNQLTRRGVLGALAVLPLAFHAPTRANDTGLLKIAQSTALSGPLGELGQAMHQDAKACFAAINAQGGVNGRPIELAARDDAYDVKRALANVQGFIEDRSNFALFNCMGTPMIEAMLPQVIESGIPFFAPFSGALSARPMGDDATGIAISQVVPLPANTVVPMVREFQQAWKAAGVTLAPPHLALEGYINARVFAEALRRAGRNPTRSSFIDSTWNLKRHDLGGFEVSFSDSATNASRFVELTMVSREGRFIR